MAQQGVTSRGMRPGAQALEAHQRTLFRHLKNEFFSKKIGQNMPKKGCKIAVASGALPLNSRWPSDSRVVTLTYWI